MKSCHGCRHLFEYKARCRLGYQTEINPYTGKEMGWNILSVDEARSVDGICGPEATRYQVKFWRRLFNRMLRIVTDE